MSTTRPTVDLDELIRLFYQRRDDLGQFRNVESETLSEDYRRLLDHEGHMTVTVEAFYGSLVDLQVHRTASRADAYSREITLSRQTDGAVVQYGIVRLNKDLLAPKVWREIESQTKPLGRVLIEYGVLRQVQLCSLWQVSAGPALAELLDVPPGTETFARTAWIICNREPAIELLEIVAPPDLKA